MKNATKAQRILGMQGNEIITMLTAYDYSMAAVETQKKVDMILVGDSAHFILNGKDTTRGITVEQMAQLTKRVAQGVYDHGDFSLVVGDLPAGSYDCMADAVHNATLLWEAGADAIKLEGATEKPYLAYAIKKITQKGIPVVGHIGYTPQSETLVDKGHVQGKTKEGIAKLIADYEFLTDAGVFSIVLECVPWQVSQYITQNATVPSIGIGAGPHCDGQVLVVYDMLGLSPGINGKMPKFVWQYECDAPTAIGKYVSDVKERKRPLLDNSYALKDSSLLEVL